MPRIVPRAGADRAPGPGRPRRCAARFTLALLAAALGAPEPMRAMPSVRPVPHLGARAVAELAELGAWKASRDAIDRKIDSRILFALDRAAGRFGHRLDGIEGLPLTAPETLADPTADARLLLDVDLSGKGESAAARGAAAVERLGGSVVVASERFGSLRVRLPASAIRNLAAESGVRRVVSAREAYTARFPTSGRPGVATVGPVTSEGDRVHRADEARDRFALTGAGTKVCVLSNGIASLGYSQDGGELPEVEVLPGQQGTGDEGTAMLEIVHDLAPGAALGFATAFGGLASFADNVLALAASGCGVVVDDVIYLDESPFQDSIVAGSVDAVAAAGVLYLSSAGNEGNLGDGTSGTWEGDFQANGTIPPLPGVELHDFGDGGVSNRVTDSAPAVALHWTDPFAVSANDYDLYVMSDDLSKILRFSNDTQDGVGGDDDPVEIVSFLGNGAFVDERIVVARVAGADRLLNVIAFRGETVHATDGALRGHTAAVGAVATAAAPAAAPYATGQPAGPFPAAFDASQPSETFSADGPRRIFFAADGTLLPGAPPGDFSATGGVVRAKPDLTAADGVATSVGGFERFFGTSAAAPHAAAIAALLAEAQPGADAATLRAALEGGALDVELPGVDAVTGHGLARTVEMLEGLGVPARANVVVATVQPVELFGNGDGVPDPGETYRLEITLENVGGAGATAVAGTLAGGDPAAEVLAPAAAWPDLAPGSSAPPLVAPVVRIAPGAACGTSLPLSLTLAYGGGTAPRTLAFSLATGAPGAPVTVAYAGPPVAIPDALARGVPGPPALVPLPIAGFSGRVADLDFHLDGALCTTDPQATTVGLSHGFVGELVLELVSPAGTELSAIVFADGFGNNFCGTWLDDESGGPSIESVETPDNPFTGSFTPARPLSRFDGESANGVWTLRVTDWNRPEVGFVRAWSLVVTPAVCHPAASVLEVPALAPAALAVFAAALAGAALVRLRSTRARRG